MADRPVTKLPKSEVLAGLFAVWDDIEALLAGLPEDEWQAASPLPGWDVKAVMAHMIGTESFLAGVPAPQADIDVSTLEHVHNDIGVMNECWVRYLAGSSGGVVLARFSDITAHRRKALKAMPDEEWDAVTLTPVGQESYGRFMRVRVFDCWMHEQDIREALRWPSSEEQLRGPASELALDEIAATMGYVVGKRAKAPEGSRVLFELTGALSRSIRVSVDGRAQVVDDFGGQEPTVTIRLDGVQFTRLTGGRPMCRARPHAVEFDGDKDLAAQIVKHLNFVI